MDISTRNTSCQIPSEKRFLKKRCMAPIPPTNAHNFHLEIRREDLADKKPATSHPAPRWPRARKKIKCPHPDRRIALQGDPTSPSRLMRWTFGPFLGVGVHRIRHDTEIKTTRRGTCEHTRV